MCARMMKGLACMLAAAVLLTGCYPPPVSYPYTKLVTERRSTLKANLLALLPENERSLPAAQEEAQWLADTAYKAAAGIARINNSNFPGWAGNALINAHIQDRGLCWHYQHDMFRELRRRHLEYFYLGCCQRDEGAAVEHNAIYIRAAHGHWPDAILMDPWPGSGRLTILNKQDILIEKWQDVPDMRRHLASVYTENHQYPLEHWERVKSDEDPAHYVSIFTPEGRNSRQGKIMFANMERGLKKRNGRLTDY